jgi:hypothetical protein
MTKKIKNLILSAAFIIFLTVCQVVSLNAQVLLDFETGIVITGYNDVRIPGNNGTLFSLNNDLEVKPVIFYRIKVNYTIGSRHTLSLLYAPLTTHSSGRMSKPVEFAGAIFPSNSNLNATYKFNSYRLTYRYDLFQSPNLDFGLGFTAKIRDARIALSSSGIESEKTNVGFVPIINFRLFWKIDDKFGLLLDGDALAAPQGRAEDVLIAATYKFSDKFGIRAGYRILEGGADNDEVYNFALFHYASVAFTITL